MLVLVWDSAEDRRGGAMGCGHEEARLLRRRAGAQDSGAVVARPLPRRGRPTVAFDGVVVTREEVAAAISGRLRIGKSKPVSGGNSFKQVERLAPTHELCKSGKQPFLCPSLTNSVRHPDTVVTEPKGPGGFGVDRRIEGMSLLHWQSVELGPVDFVNRAAGIDYSAPLVAGGKLIGKKARDVVSKKIRDLQATTESEFRGELVTIEIGTEAHFNCWWQFLPLMRRGCPAIRFGWRRVRLGRCYRRDRLSLSKIL